MTEKTCIHGGGGDGPCRVCEDQRAPVVHHRKLAGSFVTGAARIIEWSAEDNVTGGAVIRVRGSGCGFETGYGINEMRALKAAVDAWFAAHPEVTS